MNQIRAIKRGRFDVRYFYDHLNRLSTRKDNFGNVTQFFYTNHKNPNEVSIYRRCVFVLRTVILTRLLRAFIR